MGMRMCERVDERKVERVCLLTSSTQAGSNLTRPRARSSVHERASEDERYQLENGFGARLVGS